MFNSRKHACKIIPWIHPLKNHNEYLIEIKSSTVSVDHDGY